MSHFTVIVIGDAPEDQLAPYQENNMGDCPEEYMQFEDNEAELREEYETKSATKIRLDSGELVNTWEKAAESASDKTEIEVPFKELYSTFEEFAEEWHGYRGRDEKTGKYGYWSNPNAKWDWYSLGGRWSGYFKYKPGADVARLGRPGVFDNKPTPGYCDQILMKDLDLEGMKADIRKESGEQFDKVVAVIAGREVPTWESIRTKYSEEDIQKARNEYHNIQVVKDLEAARLMPFMDEINDVYCNFDREKYLEKQEKNVITSFAVVKDGKWYERGQMGWWGMVSDEKDDNRWNEEFYNLISNLPGDTLLSAYDCHI